MRNQYYTSYNITIKKKRTFHKERGRRYLMYQSDTKSHAGWSQNVLKYIAMGTMLLNHIATIFLPAGTVLCELFTTVGYFTAISMVYFLVEGYGYTRSKRN